MKDLFPCEVSQWKTTSKHFKAGEALSQCFKTYGEALAYAKSLEGCELLENVRLHV
jgi:hypothetical protein